MEYVFVSFRPQDTRDMAWRLVDYLRREDWLTLFDMDTFGAGDFREAIRKAVEGAAVVMVVVGQKWLNDASSDGLSSPGEWVQVELELAFATGTPVLPVLVHGSTMPRPERLPESIRAFAFQQAVAVRSDAHFPDDARRVGTMLDQLAPQLAPRRGASVWWKRLTARLFRRLQSDATDDGA